MINLSYTDTLNLFIFRNKINAINKRYKTKTKFKWYCLNCGDTIFINYDALGLRNIFCNKEKCQSMINKNNIIQLQYLRKMKEAQLNLTETIL